MSSMTWQGYFQEGVGRTGVSVDSKVINTEVPPEMMTVYLRGLIWPNFSWHKLRFKTGNISFQDYLKNQVVE